MRNIRFGRFLMMAVICGFAVSGCGYTTHSLMPTKFKSIDVQNFKNSINVAAEQSNVRMYRGYIPNMETEVTKAVINRYLFDGNLRVAEQGSADLTLKGELVDFKREGLRYDANQSVEEYRVKVIVNIQLIDAKTGQVEWVENGFTGETTYNTSGSLAKSEDAATRSAIEDLARRIVERTVEAW